MQEMTVRGYCWIRDLLEQFLKCYAHNVLMYCDENIYHHFKWIVLCIQSMFLMVEALLQQYIGKPTILPYILKHEALLNS